MVLIDTSIWIDADNQPDSSIARELRSLLDRDEVATTDIVIAEVLQGAPTDGDFERISSRFRSLRLFHAEQQAWGVAARLSFELRRSGLTTPLSDLLVAAVALKAAVPVFATDRHFARVPGLELHKVRP